MMWLSYEMTVLLNLWEEMGEPCENKQPLFSKQPYRSSTWEVSKRCAVMKGCVLAHPAGLRGESIRLSRYLASKSPKPSTSSAPPFKQPLDSNRKSPTVFSSKHEPTTAAAPRFPDYSCMDPCHKLGITRHLKPFAEHLYPRFVFLFTTYFFFWQTSISIPSVAPKS